MRLLSKFLVGMAVVVMSTTAWAQPCGDVNEDGGVDVGDLVQIVDYIAGGQCYDCNLANADCDGVPGITISDANRLGHYLFLEGTLDCTVSGAYSFTPSPNDTIFLPTLKGVPEGISHVYLLVRANFTGDVDGFYVPMLRNGTEANGVFRLGVVLDPGLLLVAGLAFTTDTAVLIGVDAASDTLFEGYMNLFLLRYDRIAPGEGDIAPEAVDRQDPWRISIERNGDLYVPTIAYYDAPPPQGTVISLSDHGLAFAAIADLPSPDSFNVDFTSALAVPIDFHLIPSASWMGIDDYEYGTLPYPTYETPATVLMTATAIGLNAGNYDGVIRVYYENEADWPAVDSIMVTLTVDPGPMVYPIGDFDCDGKVTIADLLFMVNYMFAGGPPPHECP